MILPPSIKEFKVLVDKPDDYGCYMYKFVLLSYYIISEKNLLIQNIKLLFKAQEK